MKFDPERRLFLKEGTLGLVAGLSVASEAARALSNPIKMFLSENGIVYHPRQAWSDRNWFPHFELTALENDLPRLHDDWWIFHMHDILNFQIFGQSSFTLQWGREENSRVVETYGNDSIQVGAAGYCPEEAIASALESDPGEGRWFKGEWYDRRYLVGFLVAKHIGDPLVRLPLSPISLRAVLEQAQPAVVNLPEKEGDWWRAVNGISEDGQSVVVTNFGFKDKELPFRAIKEAYIPIHDDSLTFDPAQTTRVHPRVPGLNEQLINLIVYGSV